MSRFGLAVEIQLPESFTNAVAGVLSKPCLLSPSGRSLFRCLELYS
jgi:hypothetical protein